MLLAVLGLGLVVGAGPLSAAPPPEPPDVVGLPVTEATRELAEWNKAVVFIYDPPADSGLGVDVADVVVSRVAWREAPQTTAVARPVATLTLGRRVPKLTGLTRAEALDAIDGLDLELAADPAQAGPAWVVRAQRPAAGTILEFTPANTVTVSLEDPTPPPPPPRYLGLTRTGAIAVGGGFLGLLMVLVVLGSLLVRRSVRRRSIQRSAERPDSVPAEHIEVRVFAGGVDGPELVERRRT
jgi:hypothetical protein